MSEHIIEIISGQHVGARFPLNGHTISIGRDATNTIRLEDNGVSRKHAQIAPENGAWIISDLNSKNGVLVSGKKIQPGTPTIRQCPRLNIATRI